MCDYWFKTWSGEPFQLRVIYQVCYFQFQLKSVAFGNDKISELFGSEANTFITRCSSKTTSNNNGAGLLVEYYRFKLESNRHLLFSNKKRFVKKHENTTLGVHGRHDTNVVVEGALAMLDLVK